MEVFDHLDDDEFIECVCIEQEKRTTLDQLNIHLNGELFVVKIDGCICRLLLP